MAGQAAPDPAPVVAPAPSAPTKTAEELASEKAAEAEAKLSEKAAAEAKASLQLFRVTAEEKLGSPNPHQAYALSPGANHFEAPLPAPVAERFAMFQKAGTIKVELLDGDGKATPWTPPEKK